MSGEIDRHWRAQVFQQIMSVLAEAWWLDEAIVCYVPANAAFRALIGRKHSSDVRTGNAAWVEVGKASGRHGSEYVRAQILDAAELIKPIREEDTDAVRPPIG